MARKTKFKLNTEENENEINDIITPDIQDQEEKKEDGRGKNEKSRANIHPRIAADVKTPQRYMQINVWEYEDYLYRMAKLNNTQITKYVMSLIKKDFEENATLYEALKTKKDFDKPKKTSNNKKKK